MEGRGAADIAARADSRADIEQAKKEPMSTGRLRPHIVVAGLASFERNQLPRAIPVIEYSYADGAVA